MDRDPTPAQPDPSDPLGIDLEARLGEIVKAAAREAAAARRDVEARRSAAAAEAERYLEEARLSIDAEAAERAVGQALALAQHGQKDMLDIELRVVLLVHDLLGFLKCLLRLIGKPF